VIVASSGDPGGGTAGSGQNVPIRLLRYPTFKEAGVAIGVQVDPNYPPVFSPDGSNVAFQCGWKDSGACRQLVVDVATGRAREVASQARGLPLSWLPNERLLLAHADSPIVGPLEEWNGSKVVASRLPEASWAIAAQTGAVALIKQAPDESHTTQVLGSGGQPLGDLPGIAVLWSPDGSQLAIETDDHQAVVLLTVP
jgi:Tol biopolymer transport system component